MDFRPIWNRPPLTHIQPADTRQPGGDAWSCITNNPQTYQTGNMCRSERERASCASIKTSKHAEAEDNVNRDVDDATINACSTSSPPLVPIPCCEWRADWSSSEGWREPGRMLELRIEEACRRVLTLRLLVPRGNFSTKLSKLLSDV